MKDNYEVSEISLEDAESLIKREHSLQGLSYHPNASEYKFYGLFYKSRLVGATQYTSYDFGRFNKVMHDELFGCHTEDCKGFWSLCRLAVSPLEEHNITSWFLSRTMKMVDAKVIVTAAEEDQEGTIYSATNFDYYGKMYERDYSAMEKQMHVYLKIYDKNLHSKWKKT